MTNPLTGSGKTGLARRLSAVVAAILLGAALSLPAAAQIAVSPPASIGGATLVPGQAPYETQILRLSEILGAIQAIDALCGTETEPPWRAEMTALIDAEARSADRKAKFVAYFNRGYKSFAEVHRTCSDSARVLRRRYLREGAELAHDLVTRFAMPAN